MGQLYYKRTYLKPDLFSYKASYALKWHNEKPPAWPGHIPSLADRLGTCASINVVCICIYSILCVVLTYECRLRTLILQEHSCSDISIIPQGRLTSP